MPSSQRSDATFVTTTGETESQPRGTFVIPTNVEVTASEVNPNTTYHVNDETVTVQPINDQTIVVTTKSTGGAIRKRQLSAASIMTDDDSDYDPNVDEPLKNVGKTFTTSTKTATIVQKKNPKELFK